MHAEAEIKSSICCYVCAVHLRRIEQPCIDVDLYGKLLDKMTWYMTAVKVTWSSKLGALTVKTNHCTWATCTSQYVWKDVT
ncbi:hypothetical protein DEO72_LG10g1217 [Vigna unguiculata]|uniref:Uncharacterized protein n=1 Tax=Vigna unguiculata TaxID=3917 RepID=A0A4D6NB42_VIGUN|nr:hypothetical protein DEO72_LG10g1217 [Vigna unguiculata]